MSYTYPHNAYPGNTYGAPSHDNRILSSSPHSHQSHAASAQAQVVSVARTSRSLSSSRTTAPGQVQPIDSYGTGQSWEQASRYAPAQSHHAQPYISSQSQLPSSPIQDQAYHQSIEQHIRPPDQPPQQPVSAYGQPRRSVSQQRHGSVPHNVGTQPSHAQQAQYQYGGQDFSSRSQQQQLSSQYQQQQAPSTHYQQQQHPSIQTQYQQQQLASTHYQQQQYTSSGYQYSQQQQSSAPQYPQGQKPHPSPSRYSRTLAPPPETSAVPFVASVPGERPPRRGSGSSRDSAQTGSTCRFPGCRLPVTMDVISNELSEYCGAPHMQDDLERGVIKCPACGKCPRRINSEYCGVRCQRWAAQQQQPQRQQQQGPTSAASPQALVSPPGSFNWGVASGSLLTPKPEYATDGSLSRPLEGQVLCLNCNRMYPPRGRSASGHLPPCPSCGYSGRYP